MDILQIFDAMKHIMQQFLLLYFVLNVLGAVIVALISMPAKKAIPASLSFAGVQLFSVAAGPFFVLVPLFFTAAIFFITRGRGYNYLKWLRVPMGFASFVSLLGLGGIILLMIKQLM